MNCSRCGLALSDFELVLETRICTNCAVGLNLGETDDELHDASLDELWEGDDDGNDWDEDEAGPIYWLYRKQRDEDAGGADG